MSILGITSGGGAAGSSPDPATVLGPASATDNALVRFDGTTGKLIQNSSIVFDDLGALSGVSVMTTSSGYLVVNGGGDEKVQVAESFLLSADAHVKFYNDNDISSGSADVGIKRLAAGKLQGTNGNVGSLTAFMLTATVGLFQGTGSPEGAVTAGIGSLYMQTDGGAGTSAYVKESGAGNTGWKALVGL